MFERAVDIVLQKEGVLSDDPRDDGGLTKYGISSKAYPDLDILTLTRADAIGIYRRDYWERCGCDAMPWWAALSVFDCAVNQGAGTAARILQQTLKVNIDGRIGPITQAHARRAPAFDTLADFMSRRAYRYAQHPDWPAFGRGWMRRLFLIQQLAITEQSHV